MGIFGMFSVVVHLDDKWMKKSVKVKSLALFGVEEYCVAVV